MNGDKASVSKPDLANTRLQVSNVDEENKMQKQPVAELERRYRELLELVGQLEEGKLKKLDFSELQKDISLTVAGSIEKALEENPVPDLTQEEKNYLYNLGVKHFNTGSYASAISLFQLLVNCEADNITYGKALAGALHAKKDYLSAFFTYIFTYLLDMENESECLFYGAVCLFEKGELERAMVYFDNYLNSQPQNEKILAKAKFYVKSIENTLVETKQPIASPQPE